MQHESYTMEVADADILTSFRALSGMTSKPIYPTETTVGSEVEALGSLWGPASSDSESCYVTCVTCETHVGLCGWWVNSSPTI